MTNWLSIYWTLWEVWNILAYYISRRVSRANLYEMKNVFRCAYFILKILEGDGNSFIPSLRSFSNRQCITRANLVYQVCFMKCQHNLQALWIYPLNKNQPPCSYFEYWQWNEKFIIFYNFDISTFTCIVLWTSVKN